MAEATPHPQHRIRICAIRTCPEYAVRVAEPASYRDGDHFRTSHTNPKPGDFVTVEEFEVAKRRRRTARQP